jgi:DNA-directed RNA polymerase
VLPDGYAVVNLYAKNQSTILNSYYVDNDGERRRERIKIITQSLTEVDEEKSTVGFLANYIHSIDAYMLREISRQTCQHTPLIVIHDSFGTTPQSAVALDETIRYVFTDFYQQHHTQILLDS